MYEMRDELVFLTHSYSEVCVAELQGNKTCPYCKKAAQFIEINRSLKPDLQIMFRNPRELAAEYMKNLGSVLDFQVIVARVLGASSYFQFSALTPFATVSIAT